MAPHQPDRRQLAADVIAELEQLNPDDRSARTALSRRITDAGITHTMHAEELALGHPTTTVRRGTPFDQACKVATDNYVSRFAAQLTTLDWPPNKRIEHELAQLLFLLDDDPTECTDPGDSEIFSQGRSRLHELLELGVHETTYHDTMMAIITGPWISQIARTLAEFKVPDLLWQAPLTPEELAQATNADGPALLRIMRAAVGLGLAGYDETSGRFTTTSLLDRLRTDSPNSLRNLAIVWNQPGHWLMWGALPEVARTGKDQAPQVLGVPTLFDYFADHPDEADLFTQAVTDLSIPIIREAIPKIEVTHGETIVDLGGAAGEFVLQLLERNPGTTGIVFDLPHVVDAARGHIHASSLSHRCTAEAGDFFTSIPTADVFLMKFILHDWNDDQCVALLQQCRRAMHPASRLVVVDMVIGPLSDPGPAVAMDINMLALTPGREHTLDELDSFFAAAGLTRSRTTALTPPYHLIEAVPN